MDIASENLATHTPGVNADTSPEPRDAQPGVQSSEITLHSDSAPEQQSERAHDNETPALPPRPELETEEEPAAAHMVHHPEQPEDPEHDARAPGGTGGAQEQEELPPQIAALRAMFPDFDAAVLYSVLESVGGDQDRAVDVLLGMSDPDYVSTEGPSPSQNTDLALDEQLARQLALEDQEQQQRRHATGQQWPRREPADQRDVPYQPRQRARSGAGAGAQQDEDGSGYVTGSERGDFQEFQETVSRLAESGKRTFSSIVSKVKAKINEYDQGKSSQAGAASNTTPQWGAAPPPQLDRHTAAQAYSTEIYGQPRAAAQPQAPVRQLSLQGYDADEPTHQIALGDPPVSAGVPSTPPNTAAVGREVSSATTSPTLSPRMSGDVPRPLPVGSPINAAKIGLLPKRPVSLLGSQAPPHPVEDDDDDDSEEYAENPFEEGSK
ncbi:hypothetical protein CERSUDRAFT_87020 [Gelatoporia subvermispora B]|uniref:CUE domain-containing protein n=1 Tax=Ceriporiopsis subvermispora (strain B) TaxID=914234 RepID=M2PD54_CERS8|nr:hypothetical protein CERSUDRAFT_87020 [Gelatoporia subvermispora B]